MPPEGCRRGNGAPPWNCCNAPGVFMDFVVIALYMIAMVAVGFWAKSKAKSEADYLVAGRRLGPMLYAGTMAALVMGGGAWGATSPARGPCP